MSKKTRNHYRDDYSSEFHPNADGKAPVYHKPRRNYWGNLYEEDTLVGSQQSYIDEDSSDSLFDAEDDHDSYYGSDGYD